MDSLRMDLGVLPVMEIVPNARVLVQMRVQNVQLVTIFVMEIIAVMIVRLLSIRLA